MGAITFLSSPSFSDLVTPVRRPSSTGIAVDTNAIPRSPSALLYALGVRQDLIRAFLSLAELSATLSGIISMPNTCPAEQRIHVLEQTYAIQYHLLRSLSSGDAADSSQIEECLKVAGLLYMHVTRQDFPLYTMGMTRLLDRLMELVTDTDFDSAAKEHLLLWLLFM